MRIPETHFFLDPNAVSGLQAQLREQIVVAILERRFPPGAKLPATRRLADHLSVARVTVNLAYQALEADGYLASRPRSGIFVSDDPPGLHDPRDNPRDHPTGKNGQRTAKTATRTGHSPSDGSSGRLDWAKRLGFGDVRPSDAALAVPKPHDWRSYPYPFVFGQTDIALFPHNEWRDCARRALGRREFNDVSADMRTKDDPQLVGYTLSHGLPARGVKARHDQLLITMGAQNALWLATQILSRGVRAASPRRTLRVAIENPCYPEMRAILADAGADVLPVPVDRNGLDPDDVPSDVDLVCVSPSHHAPTGASMPRDRRRALLARARRDDFAILEDDYDVELRSARPPTPALKADDVDDRVIYVGSYSKPLFPGLRLGYLVAAAPIIDAASALRSLVLRHPPGVTQRAAAHFLALGHYNAHLQRLRRVLAERRAIADAALRAAGFRIGARPEDGGSSLWVEAPRGIDSADLAALAADVGVLIEPGAVFFAEQPSTPFFRMAVSSIATNKIEEGVRRLATCLSP